MSSPSRLSTNFVEIEIRVRVSRVVLLIFLSNKRFLEQEPV